MMDLIEVIVKSHGKSIKIDSSNPKEGLEKAILFLKQKRESVLAIKLGISPELIKGSDEYELLTGRLRKKKI
jgi:hypothetical protein